jgi:hypothetical protein
MSEARERFVATAAEHRRAFLHALADAPAVQGRVLLEAVQENTSSAFGREHRFAQIGDVASFRRAVPIRDWEAMAPWVARVERGEPAVLTQEPPLVFVTSSGSTASRKYVPWTRRYVERCFLPFFWAAIGNTILHCPEAIERDDATLNLKWDPAFKTGATASGAPAMGASQVDFARRFGHELASEPGTRAPWALVPPEVTDEQDRIYWRLRLALESDLTAIIGINPSLVAAIPALLARWQDALLRDVRDGTVLGRRVRPPNAQRATELERLAGYFGRLAPHLAWPNLRLVYCWTGGPAALYVEQLRREFGPRVRWLPAPTAASEGPVALPIDGHPTAGPLVFSSVFFEFVDADRAIRADSETRLFDELLLGGEYQVVMTHVGGLYRYSLGDVVRVVDHVHGVPRVDYRGRNLRSSAAGENLRSAHVVDALRALFRARGMACTNAACHVDRSGTVPRYDFAAELAGPLPIDEAAALARAIDEILRGLKAEYRHARDEGLLGEPRWRWVRPGGFHDAWRERVALGVRSTQVKDVVFVGDRHEWCRLVGEG